MVSVDLNISHEVQNFNSPRLNKSSMNELNHVAILLSIKQTDSGEPTHYITMSKDLRSVI